MYSFRTGKKRNDTGGRFGHVDTGAAMPETAGDAGLTYASGDIEGLTEKIRALSSDKSLYERLVGNARARARSFDMASVMERYVRMVEDFYRTSPS
jgi:glycosyltransferase involved in cell wall biosynthesis